MGWALGVQGFFFLRTGEELNHAGEGGAVVEGDLPVVIEGHVQIILLPRKAEARPYFPFSPNKKCSSIYMSVLEKQ